MYILAPRDGVGFLVPVCTFNVSEDSCLLWSCRSWLEWSLGGVSEHSHLKTKCSRNVVIEQAVFKITVLDSHWCEQMPCNWVQKKDQLSAIVES